MTLRGGEYSWPWGGEYLWPWVGNSRGLDNYDDAAEMREKILEETEKIENQIRDRVKYWEEFHIDSLTQKE